jgi:hypothetical protein
VSHVQDEKGWVPPLESEGREDAVEAPERGEGEGPKEVAKAQGSLPTTKAFEAQAEV